MGKVLASITTHIYLDLCSLMSTLNVWLYWKKERCGSLSFEIGMQSLQYYVDPVAAPTPETEFPLQNFGCKKGIPKNTQMYIYRKEAPFQSCTTEKYS